MRTVGSRASSSVASAQTAAFGIDQLQDDDSAESRIVALFRSGLFGTALVIAKDARSIPFRTAMFFVVLELFQLLAFPMALMGGSPGLQPVFVVAEYVTSGAFERFVDAYGFAVIIGLVAAIVVIFLGLMGTVAVRFITDAPQSRAMLRILRTVANLSTSILFIPFAGILMRSFTCARSDPNADGSSSGWMGTELACGSGGHVALAVAMGAALLLFTLLSLFFAATFVDTNPTSRSWSAKIHGRMDAAIIMMKLLLTFVWGMTPDMGTGGRSSTVITGACLLVAVSAIWLGVIYTFPPFIRMRMNAIVLAEAAIFFWCNVAALFHNLLPSANLDPSLMVLLGSPVVAIAAYFVFLWKIDRLGMQPSASVKDTVALLELWARLQLRRVLQHPRFLAFMQAKQTTAAQGEVSECIAHLIEEWRRQIVEDSALHADEFLDGPMRASAGAAGHVAAGARSTIGGQSAVSGGASRLGMAEDLTGGMAGTQLMADAAAEPSDALLQRQRDQVEVDIVLTALEQAVAAYARLASSFTSSELALMCAAAFRQAYSPFQYGELLALHRASLLHPSIDVQFTIFRRVKQLRTSSGTGSSASSGSMVDRVLIEQNVRMIGSLRRSAYKVSARLWDELARPVADLGMVASHGQRLQKEISQLEQLYKKVLKADPNSTAMLRGYAAFLRDQRHADDAGLELENKADRIEEAHLKRRSRNIRRVILGMQHNGKLDASDESAAVIVMSGEPRTLGEIVQVSLGACRLLNYRNPQQMIGTNVNSVIPEPFRSKHDTFLKGFGGKVRSDIIGVAQCTFTSTASGTILPCWLQVEESPPQPGTAAPRFTAVLEPILTTEQHLMCSLSAQGYQLYAATAGALDLFNLPVDSLKAEDDDLVSVQPFLPTLSDKTELRLVVTLDRLLVVDCSTEGRATAQQRSSQQLFRTGGADREVDVGAGHVLNASNRADTFMLRNILQAAQAGFGKRHRCFPGTLSKVLEVEPDRAVIQLTPLSRCPVTHQHIIPVVVPDGQQSAIHLIVGGMQKVRRHQIQLHVLRWRDVVSSLRRHQTRPPPASLAATSRSGKRALANGGGSDARSGGRSSRSWSPAAGRRPAPSTAPKLAPRTGKVALSLPLPLPTPSLSASPSTAPRRSVMGRGSLAAVAASESRRVKTVSPAQRHKPRSQQVEGDDGDNPGRDCGGNGGGNGGGGRGGRDEEEEGGEEKQGEEEDSDGVVGRGVADSDEESDEGGEDQRSRRRGGGGRSASIASATVPAFARLEAEGSFSALASPHLGRSGTGEVDLEQLQVGLCEADSRKPTNAGSNDEEEGERENRTDSDDSHSTDGSGAEVLRLDSEASLFRSRTQKGRQLSDVADSASDRAVQASGPGQSGDTADSHRPAIRPGSARNRFARRASSHNGGAESDTIEPPANPFGAASSSSRAGRRSRGPRTASSGGSSGSAGSARLISTLQGQQRMRDRDVCRVQGVMLLVTALVAVIGLGNLLWVSQTNRRVNLLLSGLRRSGERVVKVRQCTSQLFHVVAAAAGLSGNIFDSVAVASSKLFDLAEELLDLHEEIYVFGSDYGANANVYDRFQPFLLNELSVAVMDERWDALNSTAKLDPGRDVSSAPCKNLTDCDPTALSFISRASLDFWLDAEDVDAVNMLNPEYEALEEGRIPILSPATDVVSLNAQRDFLRSLPVVAETFHMPLSQYGEYYASMLKRVAVVDNDALGHRNRDLRNALANDQTFLAATNVSLQLRAEELTSLLPQVQRQLLLMGLACFAGILFLQTWLIGVFISRLSKRMRAMLRLLLLVPRKVCRQASLTAQAHLRRLQEDEEPDSDDEAGNRGGDSDGSDGPRLTHRTDSALLEQRLMEAGLAAEQGTGRGLTPPSSGKPFASKRRESAAEHQPASGNLTSNRHRAAMLAGSAPTSVGCHSAGAGPSAPAGVGRVVTISPDTALRGSTDSYPKMGGFFVEPPSGGPRSFLRQMSSASNRKAFVSSNLHSTASAASAKSTNSVRVASNWSKDTKVKLRLHADSSRFVLLHSLRFAAPTLLIVVWLGFLLMNQFAAQREIQSLAERTVLTSILSQATYSYMMDLTQAALAADPENRFEARLRVRQGDGEMLNLAEVGMFGGDLELAGIGQVITASALEHSGDAFHLYVEQGCSGSAYTDECIQIANGALAEGAYTGLLGLVALGRKLVSGLPTAEADPLVPLVYGSVPAVWRGLVTVSKLVDPHLKNTFQRMSGVLADNMRARLDSLWLYSLWGTIVFAFLYAVLTGIGYVAASRLSMPLHSARSMLGHIPGVVRRKVPALRQAIRDIINEPTMDVVNVQFDPKTLQLVRNVHEASAQAKKGHHHHGKQ